MSFPVKLLIVLVAGYGIGAIPVSLIIGKLFYHLDLREHGSGNLGATNAFRTLGAKAGAAVLVLDFIKGVLPVVIARQLIPNATGAVSLTVNQGGWLMVVGCLAAVAGHAFSPYIKFRGGKGVATTAGAMSALTPTVFGIELGFFIIILALTRYVSVASIGVALLYPILTAIFYPHIPFILLSAVAAVFVIWLHRSNIVRLKAGTEPRFTWKSRGQGRGD